MTSMSPILVTDSRGDVIFTAGGSGGSRIISSVAQVAIYNLWLGKSILDAVDMPRLHQQLIPMELELEKRFPVVSYSSFLYSFQYLFFRMLFMVFYQKVIQYLVFVVDVLFKQLNVVMQMNYGL
jgi:hypothetical protein